MSFGTRSCPGVEVVFRSRRRRLGDEVMRGLAKASVGRECDGLETNVEVLLFDDLVCLALLVGGHDVGGGTTCSPTRRVVDVSVDGGMGDADVQDRLPVVEERCSRQVALTTAIVVLVVGVTQLGHLRRGNVDVVRGEGCP